MPPPSQNYSQRRTGYNSRYDEDGYRRDGRRYDEDGYRRDGRKKIQGYSQSQGPVRTYGGLNEYYALQDRNNRAFADPRFPGKSAGEISHNAQATNQQINKYGQSEDAYQNRFTQRGPSREANVAAAKRDGSFARLRREYNKANPGKRMNKAGDITDRAPAGEPKEKTLEGKLPNDNHSSPNDEDLPEVVVEAPATSKFKFASQTPREMYKDAASQRSIIARGDGSAEITSKYGSGSSTPRTASTPEAMVKDDFGNMVPMKTYLERRKYVADTQKGYKPYGGIRA